MRKLARIFIALFCLTFLCNKAMSQEVDLISHLGKTVGKLLMYSVKGFTFHSEVMALQGERVSAIEEHLAKTTGYNRAVLDTSEVFSKGREFKKASDDMFDHLQNP